MLQRLAVDGGHAAGTGGHGAGTGGASSVQDVLRRPGRPLPVAVRQEMEARLGADLADVRLHTDRAAQQSAAEIGARAYTSGHHVVIGAGGGDRHTLAHELSHVLQQRRGPVSGTDNGSGLRVSDPSDRFEREAEATASRVLRAPVSLGSPGSPLSAPAPGAGAAASAAGPEQTGGGGEPVVQRTIDFDPFANLRPITASLSAIKTDTIINKGLTYQYGGTKGNALFLERMLSNNGGGSNPGEPADITEMRTTDVNLVRAHGQQRAATAMHAINGDFTHGANGTADNIFMGSAKSNTQEHFHKVERPIRAAMKSGTTGLVAAYETMMANNPPTPIPGTTMVGWAAPGQNIPGASSAPTVLAPLQATFPQLTHVVNRNDLINRPEGKWPKMIDYRVTPNYDYLPYPQWPQFLLDNLNEAQKLVTAEQAKPPQQQDVQGITNELAAMQILVNHAHQLFPETFTCDADYYIASYDPVTPWYHSQDSGDYDAEV
ncbi:DUF4157 domain-containing protein [Catenulispora yoronensis]|uniref:eCIS core domain-containing protein n=1 Tax=Catenulispora yoronensis TaxID=450799 RepID=UPI0031E3631A